MRLLFIGNFVSIMGSGMNAAALSWYILQTTHSELSLGMLLLLQTLPTLLLAPVSGVLTDRTDRRRLVMLMDALRGTVIFVVAVLTLLDRVTIGEIYAMTILVSGATSIFWPTTTALTQELTTREQYVAANTLLMVGAQSGFLIAGVLVGFAYNRVGLAGVLFIDVASYLASLICYGFLRKGKSAVVHPDLIEPNGGLFVRFVHDAFDCGSFLRHNRYVVLLCTSSAILFAAIFAQNVIVPSLADRILHSGAVGFGWINAAWASGAFLTAGFVKAVVRKTGVKNCVAVSMAVVAIGCVAAPFCRVLGVVLILFLIMGAARGASVVAVNTGLMDVVPDYFMGRVQNVFAMGSRLVQIVAGLALGAIAHSTGLVAAFSGMALVYLTGATVAVTAGSRTVSTTHTEGRPVSAQTA